MAQPTAKRIKTLSVTRPIIYGNTAKKITGKRPINAPQEHTHLWTIFVRDPMNRDISYYIKKVVFKLHETYPNNTRIVETPPFELTETGWGEFDVNVKIYFVDAANEKVINFYHRLRLHPYDTTPDTWTQEVNEQGETIIKSVFFDEIVFNEPNENFFQILMSQPGNVLPTNKGDNVPNDGSKVDSNIFSRQLEQEEIDRIQLAKLEVDKQINELTKKLNEQTHKI